MSPVPSTATRQPIRIEKVSKAFGATKALREVSLEVASGSIHALIGLNGSGKSSLVKVMDGYHAADEGTVSMGEVAFVHQDLGLLPTLTVLENFVIGRPVAMRRGQIDWRTERARAHEALAEFGLEETLDQRLASLSLANQAIIACARALDRSRGAAIDSLVLDEPTSALPSHEIGILAEAMKAFAARGVGIVFITHRLQEVKDLADTVTVLRNGESVYTGPTAGLTIPDMVQLMVGEAPAHTVTETRVARRTEQPVLSVRGLTDDTLDDLDLDVFGGEIVGAFGMVGSGLERLGALVSGREPAAGGVVRLEGRPLRAGEAATRRIGYVPSDRPRRGVLPGLTVRENISVRSLGRTLRGGGISRRRERAIAERWTHELSVKPRDPEASILTLSGGNQQKAVLGRWLAIDPAAIVAEEPTQGIDVWAKQDILRRLRMTAENGTGILLTAVEPEEILDFCDRIVVLRAGRIVLDRPRPDVVITDILSAMH